MTLAEKQQALVDDYSIIEDPAERFAAIVDRGKHIPPLPEADRIDARLVPGCTSRVWLTGYRAADSDLWEFRIEAETPSIQGVAALLCELYSGATATEILSTEPSFIEAVRIDRFLTPTRLNGLRQIRKKIVELVSRPC